MTGCPQRSLIGVRDHDSVNKPTRFRPRNKELRLPRSCASESIDRALIDQPSFLDGSKREDYKRARVPRNPPLRRAQHVRSTMTSTRAEAIVHRRLCQEALLNICGYFTAGIIGRGLAPR